MSKSSQSNEKFFEFAKPPFETLPNIALKQEIKIDEEKLFASNASPFRKVFNLSGAKSDFLIGIKDMNINSFSRHLRKKNFSKRRKTD